MSFVYWGKSVGRGQRSRGTNSPLRSPFYSPILSSTSLVHDRNENFRNNRYAAANWLPIDVTTYDAPHFIGDALLAVGIPLGADDGVLDSYWK